MLVTEEEVHILLNQLNQGKRYWDSMDEYFSGESKTYYFIRADEKYYISIIDVIVGSYSYIKELPLNELQEYLKTQHREDFIEQGFIL